MADIKIMRNGKLSRQFSVLYFYHQDMTAIRYYNIVVESLKLVASPFIVQSRVLPKFVDVPDEIALTYHEAFLLSAQLVGDGLISNETGLKLQRLNEQFDVMSNNKELWTLEKLRSDDSWQLVRQLASEILKDLHEANGNPNLDFIKWVR